ncbi:TonB-dependent receptor [Novosphingobium sp. KCTC 2891]|uniref:TonB-dependent receptor n=1 Tax=Novosphingobium sp. KCTC 2891 TaxID=2989730 RepID=UPI0022214D72|nr:TonB-dependent receptor [Novosphingobium sp. KCTC 2891]MCW1384860.1 TonB-dependent receptor [Novosphingobium sp. KCTC 2891]
MHGINGTGPVSRSALAIALALGAMAQAAHATEDAATTSADGARTGGLAEIVVTATRRESNLQKTPIAVSAVDSSRIAQAAPRNIADIAKFVPNFSAAELPGFHAASYAMRGTGANNIIVYYEAPVAVLVDDFVMPTIQSQLLDTFDIAQVEVLRGPQGTLFGKNTTGGAVSVRTIKPDLTKVSGKAEASYGKFETFDAKAAINLPIISDQLALRVVGGYRSSQGYMRNGFNYGPVVAFAPTKWAGATGSGDGRAIGGERIASGRAKLLWKPSETFSTELQYQLLRDNSPVPASVNLTPKGNASYLFNLLGVGASTGNDLYKLGGITNRIDRFIDQKHGSKVSLDGVYSNTDIKLDVGTITNVIGFQSERDRLSNSYTGIAPVAPDGDVLSLFDAQRATNRKTFQEELRFASAFDGPFNFVAGGFYQHDSVDFCSAAYVGVNELFGATTPWGSYNDVPLFQCSRQRQNSEALFTEATYKITPELTLVGGFRYTWEDKAWQGRQQVAAQQIGIDPETISIMSLSDFSKYPQGVISLKTKVHEPTWRLSLSYQATPDVFAYFTYSRGFKSGGFNDNIGSNNQFGDDLDAYAAAAAATRPEYADSFEAGIKTEAFGRRLRFNLTGFYVKYRDLQRQVQVPVVANGVPAQITAFFNAASSRVYGIEGEIQARPIDNLTLNAVLGYQNGRYQNYTPPYPAGYDLSLSPLDRTPEWQWTLGANYVIPLGEHKVVLDGDVNYVGRNLYTQSISSLANNTYLPARTLFNASITLAEKDDRYFVRVIGQNLTNKTYLQGVQSVDPLWVFGLLGRPRWFGAQVGVKW